uniref:Protein Wnt n=1 Tax=Terebratalia transversa TaxID=34513 RepID=A0AAU7E8Q9_TERTR
MVHHYLRSLLLIAILHKVRPWAMNNFLMTGSKAHYVYAESVAAGAQRGIEECQHQFKWDRWNCPQSSIPIFKHTSFRKAFKETSFVNAISAAGVMYTLTRNCSSGDFDKCGCDKTKKSRKGGSNWKWGGCSDNVRFGERISKQFVDAMETGKDKRAIINLHNNEVGRRAVRKTLKLTCKCHGVSGSCTTKTCWHQLADFRAVGGFLKKRYFKAIMVDLQQGGNQYGNGGRNTELKAVSKNDLAYLESSPDYCFANKTLGTRGMLGRQCVRPKKKEKGKSWERRSCRRLCKACGLKVRKQLVKVVSSCNCKFQWCCHVKCETCVKTVKKLFCAKA